MEESRVSFNFSDISIFPRETVQPKLRLGPVGDRYEQEADRVARQVVDTISESDGGAVQRQEDLEDEEELEEEEDEQLRRKVAVSSAAGGANVGPDLESAIQRARSGGQPLSDRVRKPMERAFGADFGGVRVHADGEADSLKRSLQARAFTTGQDIFLRQGEYRPENSEGQRLLAHELTHVVQQENAPPIIQTQRDQRSSEAPGLLHATVSKVKECIKTGKEQDAIDLILNEIGKTKMPDLAYVIGRTMYYSSKIKNPGMLWCEKVFEETGRCRSTPIIFLGPGAFRRGVSYLYSVMIHEHEHINQMTMPPSTFHIGIEPPESALGAAQRSGVKEFLAHAKEINSLSETGLGKNEKLLKIQGRFLKERGWDLMSPFDKEIYRQKYESCIYSIQLWTGDFSWRP